MPSKASSVLTALVGAALSILVAVPAATAAPQSADLSPAKVAAATQVRPAAATVGEDDPANCIKTRKRLWVEGEGWVVRKVATCH